MNQPRNRTLTTALITLTLALLSLSAAQEPTAADFAGLLARDTNAVRGCVIEDSVRGHEVDGDCFTLSVGLDTARLMLDAAFLKYNDARPLDAWRTVDTAYSRLYEAADRVLGVSLLPQSSFKTIVVIAVLE